MNASSFLITFSPEHFKICLFVCLFFLLLGIFAEDEASSTGHETDWFDSSSSHVNWFFDNESGKSA